MERAAPAKTPTGLTRSILPPYSRGVATRCASPRAVTTTGRPEHVEPLLPPALPTGGGVQPVGHLLLSSWASITMMPLGPRM